LYSSLSIGLRVKNDEMRWTFEDRDTIYARMFEKVGSLGRPKNTEDFSTTVRLIFNAIPFVTD
jgi:hypothetical protein